MIFGNRASQSDVQTLTFNNDRLEAVQNFNHLAHVISSDFTDKDDVEHKLHNFSKSFNCLHRDFKGFS